SRSDESSDARREQFIRSVADENVLRLELVRVRDRIAQRKRFEIGIEIPRTVRESRQRTILQLARHIPRALVLIQLHLRFAKLECVCGHGRYDAARHPFLLFAIERACCGSPSNFAIVSAASPIAESSSALNVIT